MSNCECDCGKGMEIKTSLNEPKEEFEFESLDANNHLWKIPTAYKNMDGNINE